MGEASKSETQDGDAHATTSAEPSSSTSKISSSGNAEESTAASTTQAEDQPPASKKKRVADHQITKDEFTGGRHDDDDGDDAEVRQGFQKASAEVLKQRRIVKVARPSATKAATTIAVTFGKDGKDKSVSDSTKNDGVITNASASANPFANVALQTGTGGSASTGAKSSIFGSSAPFAGFGKATGTGFGSGFSGGFGSVTATNSTGSTSLPKFSFGGSSDNNSNTSGMSIFGSSLKFSKPSASGSDQAGGEDGAPSVAASVAAQFPTDYKVESGEENELLLWEGECTTYQFGTKVMGPNDASSTTNATSSFAVPPSQAASELKARNTNQEESKEQSKEESKEEGQQTAEASQSSNEESKKPADSAATSATTGAAATQKSWHEVGKGPLHVLRRKGKNGENEDSSSPHIVRLVQRRQGITLFLNVRLWKESVVTKPTDRKVRWSSIASDGKPCIYVFKCESVAHAFDLFQTLEREQAVAVSCSSSAVKPDRKDSSDGKSKEVPNSSA